MTSTAKAADISKKWRPAKLRFTFYWEETWWAGPGVEVVSQWSVVVCWSWDWELTAQLQPVPVQAVLFCSYFGEAARPGQTGGVCGVLTERMLFEWEKHESQSHWEIIFQLVDISQWAEAGLKYTRPVCLCTHCGGGAGRENVTGLASLSRAREREREAGRWRWTSI